MGNNIRYSICTLMNECGVRKNQIGAASSAKKKSAASPAGKNLKRIGDAWIKMMKAAINARAAATPAPLQPDMNQPAPISRADETPHHTQISESINGSLTKRRKYSALSSLPMRVTSGSFG